MTREIRTSRENRIDEGQAAGWTLEGGTPISCERTRQGRVTMVSGDRADGPIQRGPRAGRKERRPPMNITITFRHMVGTEAAKAHAYEKVAKLQKFLRQAMTAQVTLSVEGLE